MTDPTASAPPPVAASPPRFSELLPDPLGPDAEQEFIELENPGDAEIDLAGWRFQNAAGKSYVLGGHVAPHAHFAFLYVETKLALVNSGMTLTLLDAAGAVVDAVSYGASREGKAYARSASGAWLWTSTPTPGSENAFDVEPDKTSSPEPPALSLPVEPVPAPPPPALPEVPVSSAPDAAWNVEISGFMPDPVGDDAGEWVRLTNAGVNEARMDGWKLDDDEGGSAPFSLTGVTVAAGADLVLPRTLTKVALNNDADAARLIAPDGAVRQRVPYAQPPAGKSYERIDGAWRWLPEDPPFVAAPASAATAADASTTSGTDEVAEPADIADLDATDADALVSIEAVVSVPPGTLGKRTFAVQQADGAAGMFVRAYGREPLPALETGDAVRIAGRVREERGALAFSTLGRRVERLGPGALIAAERTVEELGDADDGLTVEVAGTVAHRGKAGLVLADDAQRNELEVRVRTASFPKALAGAKVVVRGVARAHDGKTEIIAFGKDAVTVTEPPAEPRPREGTEPREQEPAAPAREPLVFASVERPRGARYAVMTIALAFAAALAVVIVRRRQAAMAER